MRKKKLAEFAVSVLKKYAKENGELVRGTTDTSPLEQWLMIQMYHAVNKLEWVNYDMDKSEAKIFGGKGRYNIEFNKLHQVYVLRLYLYTDFEFVGKKHASMEDAKIAAKLNYDKLVESCLSQTIWGSK